MLHVEPRNAEALRQFRSSRFRLLVPAMFSRHKRDESFWDSRKGGELLLFLERERYVENLSRNINEIIL